MRSGDGLSSRQQDILDYIREFFTSNGYPPAIRQIQERLSISSTSVVAYNLKALEKRGALQRDDRISRGIKIPALPSVAEKLPTLFGQVPLLGSIPIIGNLFRSAGFRRGDTELVITVTPRRVRPTTQGQLKLPTERVQQPSDIDLFLNGKSEQQNPVRPVSPRRDAVNGRADAGKPGGIEGDYGHVVR